MTIAQKLSELLHGKVHYTSGDALSWTNVLGTPVPMEVRVQGDKPFVYYTENRADGWAPLSPDMARALANSLLTAADAVDRWAAPDTPPKVAT